MLVEPQIISLMVDNVINPALGKSASENSSIFYFTIQDKNPEDLWGILLTLILVLAGFMIYTLHQSQQDTEHQDTINFPIIGKCLFHVNRAIRAIHKKNKKYNMYNRNISTLTEICDSISCRFQLGYTISYRRKAQMSVNFPAVWSKKK